MLSIHWESSGTDASCSIVGDGPSVYVAHDPDGYPGLKADAQAIRLEKARVPVASIMLRGGMERDEGAALHRHRSPDPAPFSPRLIPGIRVMSCPTPVIALPTSSTMFTHA